jgi:biotin carboxylase
VHDLREPPRVEARFDHVLVAGSALAREFSRSRRTGVNLSVLRTTADGAPLDPDIWCDVQVADGHDVQSWVRHARRIDARKRVDRVVAFGEKEQLIAAMIARELGATALNDVKTAAAVADKIMMRQVLAEHGLPSVRFTEVSSGEEIAAFAQDLLPLRTIVKPAMGSGSRGVAEVVDLRDCAELFERARNVECPVAGTSRVMVEEFRPGSQLSVEGISEAGEHHVVAITRKYTDRRTMAEVGHCVPAALSSAEASAVQTATSDALTALGVRWGPSHTEVVLSPGPRVDLIETHTRLGGHGIPSLVKASTGVDIVALTLAEAEGLTVWGEHARGLPPATSANAVWFGYAPVQGRVVAIALPSSSGAAIEALVQVGNTVTDDMSRSGRVVSARASGPDESTAVRRAAQAVADARVVIECSMRAELLDC